MSFRIAVLASTNGTDLQAIIDAIRGGSLNAELTCVISNKKNCGALEKARAANVDALFISAKDVEREEYDRKIAAELEARSVDLVVLVGYMRILSGWFVRKYPSKIINVHPSLLPEFPGMDLNVHAEVLKAGKKETGMTIHYVDEGVDTGPIILQKKVAVAPDDTPETLKKKVQELEKEWYPKVIQQLATGE